MHRICRTSHDQDPIKLRGGMKLIAAAGRHVRAAGGSADAQQLLAAAYYAVEAQADGRPGPHRAAMVVEILDRIRQTFAEITT